MGFRGMKTLTYQVMNCGKMEKRKYNNKNADLYLYYKPAFLLFF